MSFIIAALIMGFAGSLHCIGMCGPLVIAVHASRGNKAGLRCKLIYHSGRIVVYGAFGLIAGAAGRSFAAFGFQQWLSVAAGLVMLIFLLWPAGTAIIGKGPLRLMGLIRTAFAALIQRRNAGAYFMLGAINGLLPCGLVYIALTASLSLSDALHGMFFMMCFGMASIPALLAAASAAGWIGSRIRIRSFRFVQAALVLVSFLVIIRGANLGIPYLSPGVDLANQRLDCCHKP